MPHFVEFREDLFCGLVFVHDRLVGFSDNGSGHKMERLEAPVDLVDGALEAV
ncbi:unnamed protein product [Ectocarpus sp. CCAP 1310/34]|nr:unnamed protein product [Ectocarpus sp. CCAP 1310/34]